MHWNFDDPAAAGGTDEEKLAKFREIRDQIGRKIRSWLSDRGIPVEAGAQGAAGM
jgi:arsenate reductase